MKHKLESKIKLKYGSFSEFARTIGVLPEVVQNWRSRGIPIKECPGIALKTGYRLRDLNDFFKPVTKIIRAEIERENA